MTDKTVTRNASFLEERLRSLNECEALYCTLKTEYRNKILKYQTFVNVKINKTSEAYAKAYKKQRKSFTEE